MGARVAPSPSRVVGERKKVPTKVSVTSMALNAPFTGEYCTLLSLHQPPKGDDPRGLWVSCLSLRELEIYDKTMLEGNLNLCMHLMNGILPPHYRGDLTMELNDIDDVMRTHFKHLALVSFIPARC